MTLATLVDYKTISKVDADAWEEPFYAAKHRKAPNHPYDKRLDLIKKLRPIVAT